jgi:alkylhydroperoxidase family enzyme
MQTRINFYKTAPEAYNALLNLEKFIGTTSLNPTHKELIKMRASQINGCDSASICTRPMREKTAKPNNASTF